MTSITATTKNESITFYTTASKRADSKRNLRRLRDTCEVTRLSMPGSSINDRRLMRYIAPMKQLTYLNLNGCSAITPHGVQNLFAKLPHIQRIDVEGAAHFSWPNITHLPLRFAEPPPKHKSFLTRRFFKTELGKELLQHSAKLAKARGITLNGKAYLFERTKNYPGYCRGYSYAAIVAHCRALLKKEDRDFTALEHAHIQFFQAIEFLLHGEQLGEGSNKATKLAEQLQKTALLRLKTLAGLDAARQKSRKIGLKYKKTTFWKRLDATLTHDRTHVAELKLRRVDKIGSHSIALFLAPKYKIADVNHGVSSYKTRDAFKNALSNYLKKYGAPTSSLYQVNIRTFQNPST